MINIVLISLSDELPERSEPYELHRLLGALLSSHLTVVEKLNIIKNEYNIPIEESVRKDVNDMCNLSQGIREEGIELGMKRGMERGMERGIEHGIERGRQITAMKMIEDGDLSMEKIAGYCSLSLEQVKELSEKLQIV